MFSANCRLPPENRNWSVAGTLASESGPGDGLLYLQRFAVTALPPDLDELLNFSESISEYLPVCRPLVQNLIFRFPTDVSCLWPADLLLAYGNGRASAAWLEMPKCFPIRLRAHPTLGG